MRSKQGKKPQENMKNRKIPRFGDIDRHISEDINRRMKYFEIIFGKDIREKTQICDKLERKFADTVKTITRLENLHLIEHSIEIDHTLLKTIVNMQTNLFQFMIYGLTNQEFETRTIIFKQFHSYLEAQYENFITTPNKYNLKTLVYKINNYIKHQYEIIEISNMLQTRFAYPVAINKIATILAKIKLISPDIQQRFITQLLNEPKKRIEIVISEMNEMFQIITKFYPKYKGSLNSLLNEAISTHKEFFSNGNLEFFIREFLNDPNKIRKRTKQIISENKVKNDRNSRRDERTEKSRSEGPVEQPQKVMIEINEHLSKNDIINIYNKILRGNMILERATTIKGDKNATILELQKLGFKNPQKNLRTLMTKTHPDRNKDQPQLEEIFKFLSGIYNKIK